MKTETKEFLDIYGGTNFDNVKFRPGAVFTSEFGLTERYKVINDKVVWGYPGIHKGIDRGGSRLENRKNPIYCPFDFGSSGYKDWKGRYVGTDVYLYSKYGFRLRVCHMWPDEIKTLDQLTSGYAVSAGTLLGPIGSCGFSTAAHSHVEVESWGFNGEWVETCEVLDEVLLEKFGSVANQDITHNEIMEIYGNCEHTKDWDSRKRLTDYKQILVVKNIAFVNQYKLQVRYRGKTTTLYSTRALFGM